MFPDPLKVKLFEHLTKFRTALNRIFDQGRRITVFCYVYTAVSLFSHCVFVFRFNETFRIFDAGQNDSLLSGLPLRGPPDTPNYTNHKQRTKVRTPFFKKQLKTNNKNNELPENSSTERATSPAFIEWKASFTSSNFSLRETRLVRSKRSCRNRSINFVICSRNRVDPYMQPRIFFSCKKAGPGNEISDPRGCMPTTVQVPPGRKILNAWVAAAGTPDAHCGLSCPSEPVPTPRRGVSWNTGPSPG